MGGHSANSKAFSRYYNIEDDTKRDAVNACPGLMIFSVSSSCTRNEIQDVKAFIAEKNEYALIQSRIIV